MNEALITELRERIETATEDIAEDERRIADLQILVQSAHDRIATAVDLIASAEIAIKALER